jgi:hypothetical protein
MKRVVTVAALVLVFCAVAEVRAGGPPPVCMAVDRLVWEPSEAAPTRIQIWGVFTLLQQGTKYGTPIRGYLYYAAPKGREEQCRKDWKVLSQLVAENHLVAFGACNQPRVDSHIRKPGDKATSPVPFPSAECGFTAGEHHLSPAMRQELHKLQAGKKVSITKT